MLYGREMAAFTYFTVRYNDKHCICEPTKKMLEMYLVSAIFQKTYKHLQIFYYDHENSRGVTQNHLQ